MIFMIADVKLFYRKKKKKDVKLKHILGVI